MFMFLLQKNVDPITISNNILKRNNQHALTNQNNKTKFINIKLVNKSR